jgi:hypothetical protein
MKRLIPAFVLLFSFSALADRFESEVNSIDVSNEKGVPHLIKLDNGRVVFVNYKDRDVLDSFRMSLKERETLAIEVDEKNSFLSAETEERKELRSREDDNDEPTSRVSFEPSVISENEVGAVFKRMRRDYQNESQCYNRAHIWAYEEFQKTGLKSMKLFMFFTSRYIRNYRYKWWFHVSPMTVSSQGDRVIDRRYTSGARTKDNWTKNFIYSGRKCPVVNRYADYRNNQQKEDCYLIPVSMYFWQPRDIETRDRTGYEKTSFKKSEVDHAYWEAF